MTEGDTLINAAIDLVLSAVLFGVCALFLMVFFVARFAAVSRLGLSALGNYMDTTPTSGADWSRNPGPDGVRRPVVPSLSVG